MGAHVDMATKARIALLRFPLEVQDDCHLWTGPLNEHGYGRYGRHLAHRLLWEGQRGPIPAGLVLMHACDTPRCVNLDHLSAGTQQENIADMIAKGRGMFWRNKKGSHNPAAKLNADIVWAIRWVILPRKMFTRREIADSYGVTRTPIDFIARGRSWPHVTQNWPFDTEAA